MSDLKQRHKERAQRELVYALDDRGRNHKRYIALADSSLEELHELIVRADKLGIPKTKIAQASGISRGTVYSILLRAQAGRK